MQCRVEHLMSIVKIGLLLLMLKKHKAELAKMTSFAH